MLRDVDLSANERSFILEALQRSVRLDGRGLDQFRPLTLSFGDEYGHAKVQLGKTGYVLATWAFYFRIVSENTWLWLISTSPASVIVRISAEVTLPRPERDSDGIFTVSVELNDMAIPAFDTGRYALLQVHFCISVLATPLR
jgi:exosome complex component RRP45